MIRLGILGGGQLGYMLAESALQFTNSISTIFIFSDKQDIPCNILKDNEKITIIYQDYNRDNLFQFSKLCDIITYEFENIQIDFLVDISIPIYPSMNYLEIIQDKYQQKKYLLNHQLPVGPFSMITILDDIYQFVNKYHYPIIMKARKGSFDGRGNIIINNENELLEWNQTIDKLEDYYLESIIDFDNELSICGCKINNSIVYFPPVKNTHQNSILLKTEYNQTIIKPEINSKIIDIYQNILDLFDTKGVICVEFFQKNNDIYINEIALRVHNTYHLSLDCANISQFDLHLSSILNLNPTIPRFINNGIMYNIISNMQTSQDIISKEYNNYVIKDYHKKSIGIRKIGHINIVLETITK